MDTTMSTDPGPRVQRVEVITSVQRRPLWSVAEKVVLVEEATRPGMSVSAVARRAGIAPSQLFAWKRRMLEGGAVAVQADDDVVAAAKVRELEKRVRDLERMLGRKTMEAEILREALDLAVPKKRPCGSSRAPGTVPDEGAVGRARRRALQPDRAGGETPLR
jgi:transposase